METIAAESTQTDRTNFRALGRDGIVLGVMLAIGIGAYLLALRHRKPFHGSWFPESLGAVLLAFGIAQGQPYIAALFITLWLLALGLRTTIDGMHRDSLPRMNLGLFILCLTIILRFFDLDINDAVKGLVFIAMGAGFLWLNVRLINQRKKANA